MIQLRPPAGQFPGKGHEDRHPVRSMRVPARLFYDRKAIAISRSNGGLSERSGSAFGKIARVIIAVVKSIIFILENVSYRNRFVFVDIEYYDKRR